MTRGLASALLSLLLAAPLVAGAAEADLFGLWLAEEPGAGTTTVVELYRDGETMAGRVVRVLDRNGAPLATVCGGCSGELRGRPISGLRFLWGLRRDEHGWGGGTVMDLRDGLTQGVTATAEVKPGPTPGTLELHAYRGLRALGQSRTWRRAPDATPADGDTPR